MTHINAGDGAAVLVRAADAEVIGFPPQTVRLLADSSAPGGRLSTQRVTLADGANGANPHHHSSSAELFYVLSGSVQLLAGDRALAAGKETSRWCRRACPCVRCRAGLRRRSADRDHSRRRAIRVFPPSGQDRYRPAVPRDPARRSGTVRHTFFDDSPVWQRARAGGQPGS